MHFPLYSVVRFVFTLCTIADVNLQLLSEFEQKHVNLTLFNKLETGIFIIFLQRSLHLFNVDLHT